jgi:hypothetical protein
MKCPTCKGHGTVLSADRDIAALTLTPEKVALANEVLKEFKGSVQCLVAQMNEGGGVGTREGMDKMAQLQRKAFDKVARIMGWSIG